MTDTVSIIITSYNYARFLPEAIMSALHQTYPAVEVMVIDDGSTDDSVAVACRHNITVLAQENQGVSAARNNAAAAARGKYLLFLDADDTLYPDSVERLMICLQGAAADTAYAYGQMEYFDSRTGIFESREFDARALAQGNYICATSLIRKDAFEAAGGFDRGFAHREDWEFYIRMLHQGYRGAFLAEPVLRYRKHKEPTRGKSKLPKRLAATRLEYLYPRFFLREILKHPLRHLYYRWRCHVGPDIQHYGPSADLPRLVKTSNEASLQ